MKKQIIAMTVATLLLTACGGSSSDNNNFTVDPKADNGASNAPSAPGAPGAPNANNSSNNPRNQTEHPLIPPAADKKDPNKGNYQGKAYSLAAGSSTADAQTINSGDLKILHIDGKRLPLQPGNINAGNMLNIGNISFDGVSYKRLITSGSNYANSKFGYVNDGDKGYLFSQGALTDNMPQSGVVKYNGGAAVTNGNTADSALATFSADFAKKTLNGQISQNGGSSITFKPVTLEADISDNTFRSKDEAAIKTEGGFYGGNARELGGLFQDDKQKLSGSFGAIRTD